MKLAHFTSTYARMPETISTRNGAFNPGRPSRVPRADLLNIINLPKASHNHLLSGRNFGRSIWLSGYRAVNYNIAGRC